MALLLKERVAVVTGGGRGIGRATAIALAKTGADVGVLARSAGQVEQVAEQVRQIGSRAFAAACDVSDRDEVEHTFVDIREVLGPIDVLVNNAGVIGPIGPTAAVNMEEWIEALATNLIGAVACTKTVLPSMLERGWGRVVNVSTGAAAGTGISHVNAYSVSKAALEMFTANLGKELVGTGVTVNAIWPGMVDSKMQAHLRNQPPAVTGEALADLLQRFEDKLLDPTQPAQRIIQIIEQEYTGEVVNIYG